MKKIILIIAIALVSLMFVKVHAQNKTILMATASQKYLGNDYWGALTAYRKALEVDVNSPKIHFKIGECQYYLKHYKHAKNYFEKADSMDTNVDKDLYLMMARTYHRLAQLDDAILYYDKYMKIAPERDLELYDINLLIKQCKYAKEMMAKKLDVNISNLGRHINSRFDDYAPSLNSKGTIMMFTSRRTSIGNSIVDDKGDHKYFEDIYVSYLEDDKWSQAENLEDINTDGHDAILSLSPDAKTMFIYKNNDGSAGDIFRSTRKNVDSKWSDPDKLPRPINTSYFESSISITADGSTMYFISERPQGYGRGDIYVTRKTGEDSWSKPKNIGHVVNTSRDEKFVFIHPNGSTLFFASKGHLTMGSYDIFKSELINGEWTEPVNLGYPINTVNEESTFSMTFDNKKLLISAEYDNSMGERDIYEIDLANVDILKILSIDSKLLETNANVKVHGHISVAKYEKNIRHATVNIYDSSGEVLIFELSSDKDGYYEVSLPFGANYVIEVETDKYGEKTKKIKLKNRASIEHDLLLDISF